MSCSNGMSKEAEEEERKLRECMLCHSKAYWRRMLAFFLDMTDQEAAERAGTAAEKPDVRTGRQYGMYVYKCIPCVAKEENCSINDAARLIKRPRREQDLAVLNNTPLRRTTCSKHGSPLRSWPRMMKSPQTPPTARGSWR